MEPNARFLKISKSTKYAIFAMVFVTTVILLMNTGVVNYVWVGKYVRESSIIENRQSLNPEKPRAKICEISIKVDKKKSILDMLSNFNKLTESFDIKIAVIEPFILYQMLETKYKKLLEKRNFNISNYLGSNNTVTYGIIGDDVSFLQKEDIIWKFRKIGFQPHFVQVPLASWMRDNNMQQKSETFTSHIFYMHYEWTIHVVVFHKRNSYLWHAALDTKDKWNIPSKNDLVFVNYDSAYEKFNFDTVDSHKTNISNLYIPSTPHYFLFQIPSSRFLECNLSRAVNVIAASNSPESHSSLTVKEFNENFLVSLQELKDFFNSLLMNFWIFSGTMLGWYRQCDIIPYTSDADYGAWVSEIDDLDYILKHFRENKKLTIRERMGVLEEALEFNLNCNGLRVDVFFMYKISNGSWSSGHRPSKGYYFRYMYPNFTLCSADLLKQKVQVPCETEDVIVTEYGSNWMNPVSSWYYESSIKNRGPNIYWDEKRRPKTFEEY